MGLYQVDNIHTKSVEPVLNRNGVEIDGILDRIRVLRSLFILILLLLRDQGPPSLALWSDQILEGVGHQIPFVLCKMTGLSAHNHFLQEVKHILIPLSLLCEP